MGGHLLHGGERIKFAFITEQKVAFSIVALCRVLDVSPSGYHAWNGRPLASRADRDAILDGHVRAAYAYGGD